MPEFTGRSHFSEANANSTLAFPGSDGIGKGEVALGHDRLTSSCKGSLLRMSLCSIPSTEALTFQRMSQEQQTIQAGHFLEQMRRRRSVRMFSPDPVPREVIENAIRVASLAPSGANQQPWQFVLVSNPDVKHRIREAAEREEREFYEHRAPHEWLEALKALGTDANKPFLDIAPYLIVVFAVDHGIITGPDGRQIKFKHYYVSESVGIAVGMLLTALHLSGLVALTHTPSPMGFLREILGRPKNERAYVLIPVGYPAEGATVPKITKKKLNEILQVIE